LFLSDCWRAKRQALSFSRRRTFHK